MTDTFIPTIEIKPYADIYRNRVIQLIFKIQAEEFGFAITITPASFESVSSYYQENGGNFWVALDGERVIGTIALHLFDKSQADVKRMYVDRDYRGKEFGVAKNLLNTLIVWCKRKKIKKVYLGTRAAYLAAHRFYEKNRFREMPKETLPPKFPVSSVDSKFYKRDISD
jgi:N-acetylglutamate synthase-like GNAT family acetyltransferase